MELSKGQFNPPKHRLAPILAPFLLFCLLLIRPAAAAAQTGSAIEMNAVIGLDGLCKFDHWYPVRVRLANMGPAFDGTIAAIIEDFPDEWAYARPMTLAEGARKEVTIYVRSKPNVREIRIRLQEGDRVALETAQATNCVQPVTPIIAAWATNASAYNVLTERTFGGTRGSLAQLALEDIPDHFAGLEMADILIISDVDTGDLSPGQLHALQTWVTNGGRLVVTGGAGWQKTVSGLSDLLPFQPTGSTTLDELTAFNRMSIGGSAPEGEVVAARGTLDPAAAVLVAQDGLPVVVRKSFGYGEVYYFSVDPSVAPLRNWPGMEGVYRSLFQTQIPKPSWAEGFANWFDAGNALSNIPGLGLPSALLICGFLGVYVLVIGPLNFFVLHRMKRRELAWVTIPVLVLGFSGVAFLLGLSIRGSRPIVHELSLLQIWPESNQARVDTLLGTFSPRRDTYLLQAGPGLIGHPVPTGGLSGSGSWSFEQSVDGVLVPDLRIDVGGIEAVILSGSVDAPVFPASLELDFQQGQVAVSGRIENNSSLRLTETVFLGPGGHNQAIGDFGPGQEHAIRFTIPAVQASPSGIIGQNPGAVADSTPFEVFGQNLYSVNNDSQIARKVDLFEAAFGNSGSRAGGYYLLGWMNDSPILSDLSGSRFHREALTLVIVALNPTQANGSGASTVLSPSLFTWSLQEGDQSGRGYSPYNTTLYNGSYSLRFTPSQPLQYEAVESLVLHLKSYGSSGASGLALSLWDFEVQDWQPFPELSWGDHAIPDPHRFVGFGGEIYLQLTNLHTDLGVQVETADFTLTVR